MKLKIQATKAGIQQSDVEFKAFMEFKVFCGAGGTFRYKQSVKFHKAIHARPDASQWLTSTDQGGSVKYDYYEYQCLFPSVVEARANLHKVAEEIHALQQECSEMEPPLDLNLTKEIQNIISGDA